MTDYIRQARAFLRTADAAMEAGDYGPSYENARTAAELAAKHLLSQQGVPPKAHNVAEALTQAGHWPAGEPFRRLSKFLGAHTRGIYGFHEPITSKEAQRALQLAMQVIEKAEAST